MKVIFSHFLEVYNLPNCLRPIFIKGIFEGKLNMALFQNRRCFIDISKELQIKT